MTNLHVLKRCLRLPFDVTQHLNLEIQTRPAKFLESLTFDEAKFSVGLFSILENYDITLKAARDYFLHYILTYNDGGQSEYGVLWLF